MSGIPVSEDRQHEETTGERILRVAAEKFAEKGYHGTGVAELGDAAGIKRGALYYHIGSKEDLLFRLSRRHVEEALARGRAVMADAVGAVAKFRLLVREHLRTLAERRSEVIVVMHEMHALTGERAVQLKDLRSEYEELFATVLREGVEEGVFRSADRGSRNDRLLVAGHLDRRRRQRDGDEDHGGESGEQLPVHRETPQFPLGNIRALPG